MKRQSRITIGIIATDILTTMAAFVLFSTVRHSMMWRYLQPELADVGSYLLYPTILSEIFLMPLMVVFFSWLTGFYEDTYYKSRLQVAGNTVIVSTLSTLVFFFIVLLNDILPRRMLNYELILWLWGLLTAFVGTGRWIWATYCARAIHSRRWSQPALVVGATAKAAQFVDRLNSMPRPMGLDVKAMIDIDDGERADTSLPVYTPDRLEEACRNHNIESVIIVGATPESLEKPGLLRTLMALDLPLLVQPDIMSPGHAGIPRFTNVSGEPLVDISHARIDPFTRNIKRVADIAVASLGLLVASPVMLAIALMIKQGDGGPIFYRQRRVGYHRRPFEIVKFRSMVVDAEAKGPRLSSDGDPRITRIGRTLRKYRLDELPNLWNVLRGDMSLVGPRPEREFFASQLAEKVPGYAIIHSVRPGLTSWGMVKYGYAASVDQMLERLKYDMLYVENVSIAVDIKILFYTINTVVTGRGL